MQTVFPSTICENDRFVRGVLDKQSATGVVPEDRRGKHDPKHKLLPEVKEEIEKHIKSFPAYVSHYSRRHTTNLYLAQNLTVTEMHELYLEQGGTKVSYSTYNNVFNDMKPKLKFKKPNWTPARHVTLLILP